MSSMNTPKINMRHRGPIESHKFNNAYNITKHNLNKLEEAANSINKSLSSYKTQSGLLIVKRQIHN